MKLFLDTADLTAIKELDEILHIEGVTTNPTILAKTNKEPKVVLEEIAQYLKDDQLLFAQVLANTCSDMMEEARQLMKIKKKNMVVKIPVTKEGLKAIKQCRKEGIPTLATAIYSAQQGMMAALNGANYLAPYVNRMENYGDGIGQVADLQLMLENYNLHTEIVAASFKNANQVYQLLKAGVDSMTLPVDVAKSCYEHPATTVAVGQFTANWLKTYHRKELFE
jgi:TalC/MipB family fructose-6-phosphate aldolase